MSLSMSAFSRCFTMWKMSQQLSGISTASWSRRRSSSLSWCQVRAAPAALLSQERALRTFGVPVCRKGHRGEQTSPETWPLSVSVWIEDLSAKIPYRGHKRAFTALPHLTACPAMEALQQERLHLQLSLTGAPSASAVGWKRLSRLGTAFSLSQRLVALSKWLRGARKCHTAGVGAHMVHFLFKLPISLISSFWVQNSILRQLQISQRCSEVNPAGKHWSRVNDNLLILWARYARDSAVVEPNLTLKSL